MPTFDYAPIAATALALVARFGKAVTLRRLNTTAPDPAVPWRGAVDPRAVPAATLAVNVVLVEPSSLQTLGLNAQVVDWVPRSQKVAVIADASDLRDYGELVEVDATTWRVVGVSTLDPGGTRLLHYVGVAR